MNRHLILSVILLCFALGTQAQWTWNDPLSGPFVHNQGWNEDGGNYRRMPLRAKGIVNDAVWGLACESAGLTIRFMTDAKDILVKYKVTGGYSMPHMPSTGVSGVDLYRDADKGFCFGSYSFGDTVRYSYHIDRSGNADMEAYTLYLPLYNGVESMSIGVPADCGFTFIPTTNEKPMVVYGTSIAQGACASRPGMAWGNILGRELNRPLINLGFSGNGKLEKEVIDFINEQDACVYIIDCMPNLSDRTAEEVKSLVKKAVRQIRARHDTPILLVEHAGYSNGVTNQGQHDAYTWSNTGQAEAYAELKKEGVKQLYYLPRKKLNMHPDSWVDYVHPSDYGMVQQATAVGEILKMIIK